MNHGLFKDPSVRMCEGVPVVYECITSPIPRLPESLTDRWTAYEEYREASLKGYKPPKDWGNPDCPLADILRDQDPVWGVLVPNDGCSPHVTWQDLHDHKSRGSRCRGSILPT